MFKKFMLWLGMSNDEDSIKAKRNEYRRGCLHEAGFNEHDIDIIMNMDNPHLNKDNIIIGMDVSDELPSPVNKIKQTKEVLESITKQI